MTRERLAELNEKRHEILITDHVYEIMSDPDFIMHNYRVDGEYFTEELIKRLLPVIAEYVGELEKEFEAM